MTDNPTLTLAQMVPCTEAEGPGRRFALWFQGCPLRCPGCCNPEFLSFRGGEAWQLHDLLQQIDQAVAEQHIEGISLLGGEPLAHAAGAAALAEAVRTRDLSVMIYTGYSLEQAQAMPEPMVHRLLAATDLLVDGPYLREQPDRERRWIGSTNQRIHFLSDRYRPDDPCWQQRNTLEIRLRAGELTINGFPANHAASLWKGLKPTERQSS